MERSPEMIAEQLRTLVAELQAAGRQDLLLKAISVPVLEQLRLQAAKGRLSRLMITRDYRFLLIDLDNKEIELQPVHKAVYLLFLAHPEGIEFKRLRDYREELLKYYMATAKLMDKEKIIEGVEHLVNPLDNAINEKCSRIRAAFINLVDESLLSNYIVAGKSGDVKKVALSRHLVVWQ